MGLPADSSLNLAEEMPRSPFGVGVRPEVDQEPIADPLVFHLHEDVALVDIDRAEQPLLAEQGHHVE
jgi:hypothetical protein